MPFEYYRLTVEEPTSYRKQAENSSSVMFVPRSTPDESTEAQRELVTEQQNDVDSFHSAVVEEFRLQRDQLPEAGTLDIPSGFIFPLTFTSWRQYMMTHDPTVELVSNMDHELTIKLLIYSTKWLSPRIPQRLSQWMYAIMTRVSEPLEASDVSVLRDLAKRAKTLTHRDQLDDTTLFTLQFVITIVGAVFGQRDLLS